ncbi:class III poly(R)-hydroxyalkanoic acid synthase subunit PhaC [Eremococcus coleocola]|uniref:Poly(3-hydroxyalkanoate) polymerase subunit PhaC n=1 Tax=Eremococcus coleocola ACS-139-V-Col8 TaxID=908337 RepID=E4KRA7_9LACT|nr:class III poly(R)-hydroxyalkanoic acid synthase subunit PhaC [Eremococcus coleocola]EFR30519.1 poly(R)-hydroxyalkanoic acid synthase, class III, PhaC subunit [Eremococcus coleocola ACS-139-V-Col8]
MFDELLEINKQNFEDVIHSQKKMLGAIDTLAHLELPKKGVSEKEAVYTSDKVTLYHYVPKSKKLISPPVLISYALVNKYYMMDLQEGKSFIGGLLDAGLDLYLIDWGYPTKDDMYMTMEDYILGYLDEAVDYIREESGYDQINLMGICQGGTFSTIYTSLRPEKIKNLITLVTPIDFDTDEKLLFKWGPYLDIDSIVDAYGVVPGDFMNNGFLMLQPVTLTTNKYLDLIDSLDDADKMTNFIAMEKWIFDSPGQAGETIRQFNNDLYRDNKLVKGELMIGDEQVDMKNIQCPVLHIYAKFDHQVPNSSSDKMKKYVGSKDFEEHCIETGHIGLFVSGKSQKIVVPMISDWVKDHSK